jgi:hypothetical protein
LSFLTKFFIILHVVLTMLVVSGLVVFVNRVEDFNGSLKAEQNMRKAAEQRATSAEGAMSTLTASTSAFKEQTGAEIARVRTQLNVAQTGMRERDAQLATAQQNLSSADARLQATTAALQTAQKTVAVLQDQLTQTRLASDKTQQQNTELLTVNSDLTSRRQILERQLRNANEEVEALQTEIASIRDRGNAPARTADAGAAASDTPAPTAEIAINGIINDRKDINGVQTATISVGSRDNVVPGMVFNVIDRGGAGDFLGYLTVDRVEDREAIGRLAGPRVADIKKGNEVRTQL